jgi:uncharacterized protein
MSGETNLNTLLRSIQPFLCQGEYVFCSIDRRDNGHSQLNPVGMFRENEGITLILERQQADAVALLVCQT